MVLNFKNIAAFCSGIDLRPDSPVIDLSDAFIESTRFQSFNVYRPSHGSEVSVRLFHNRASEDAVHDCRFEPAGSQIPQPALQMFLREPVG